MTNTYLTHSPPCRDIDVLQAFAVHEVTKFFDFYGMLEQSEVVPAIISHCR